MFLGRYPHFLNPSAAPLGIYHRAEPICAEQEKNSPARILGLLLTFLHPSSKGLGQYFLLF